MISNHDEAAKVLSETDRCFRALNALLTEVQRSLPTAEFDRLRLGIGRVLGYLYTEVEAPIHALHPDLEPPGMREAHDDSAAP